MAKGVENIAALLGVGLIGGNLSLAKRMPRIAYRLPSRQHLATDVPDGKRGVGHGYDQTVGNGALECSDVLRPAQLVPACVTFNGAAGGSR